MKPDNNINKLKTDKHLDEYMQDLSSIIDKIAVVQEQAKALGLFGNHRDLAECRTCELFEDVTFEGKLIVSRKEEYVDTGLVFKELKDHAVVCPGCGAVFCPFDTKAHFSAVCSFMNP